MMTAFGLILHERFTLETDPNKTVFTVTREPEHHYENVKAMDPQGNFVGINPYAFVTVIE